MSAVETAEIAMNRKAFLVYIAVLIVDSDALICISVVRRKISILYTSWTVPTFSGHSSKISSRDFLFRDSATFLLMFTKLLQIYGVILMPCGQRYVRPRPARPALPYRAGPAAYPLDPPCGPRHP